jgi:hypothetical protein
MAFGRWRSGEWCATAGPRHPPAEQDIGVPELPDDLFWLKALLRHDLPPLEHRSVATLPLDQFPGGRSVLPPGWSQHFPREGASTPLEAGREYYVNANDEGGFMAARFIFETDSLR